MSKKRTNYSAEFKAKVIGELFRGEKSLNALATTYQIAPATLSKWHKQFMENLPSLFGKADQIKDQRIADLEQELQASQQKIGQLTIERDWLEKNLTKSLDRMARTGLVLLENKTIAIKRQCELLGINRSSRYRKHRRDSEVTHGESLENLEIMAHIDPIHLDHPSWEYRKMTDYLRRQHGYVINRKRTRRLMRTMDIMALYPGPNLSKRYHAQYVRPYLLRNLVIDRIDQVWGIDITYLPLRKGFLYLFVIIDWHSRQIVDYEVSYSLEKTFVQRCLKSALRHRKPDIINSDPGSHFTNATYLDLIQSHGVRISMDGKGQALDNIRTERFFRSLKYDDVYLKEYTTPAERTTGICRYIHDYNTIRERENKIASNKMSTANKSRSVAESETQCF